MKHFNRRDFMKSTMAAGFATFIPASVFGANDEIRIAIAGVRGRGTSHIKAFDEMKGVRIVAFCDVERNILDQRVAEFEKHSNKLDKYNDIRKVLENKDIDAISCATPNHWHSLMTLWACQAGKDVYVEKPLSHNLYEGRKIVEAARKYKRIVQHGTQSRADKSRVRQAALARSGKYGKLLIAKGYCCKPRWTIGFKPIATQPEYLDFNIWLGPAPQQPYHANLVHYNWHWFWDFGNGDLGNQGVHQMDLARWGTGHTLPNTVVSLGGRWVDEPYFKDQGQTPNQIVSIYDYGDCLLLFETRGLVHKKDPKFPRIVDVEFYCEDGLIKDDGFYPNGKNKPEKLAKIDLDMKPGSIFENFIYAVRSRKYEDLHADVLQGHYSSALCHLGNISYRLGSHTKFEKPKDLGNNKIVGDSIMTMLANTQAIGVDPEKAALQVGPKLSFNPDTEKFADNPAANQLLTRPYRQPFVVTDKV